MWIIDCCHLLLARYFRSITSCFKSINFYSKIVSAVGFVPLAGVYKPRVRCYDVAQMSMKFERCMDSEVVRFLLLADDYTKVALFHFVSFLYVLN